MDFDYRSSLSRRLRAVHSSLLRGLRDDGPRAGQSRRGARASCRSRSRSSTRCLIEDGSVVFVGGPVPQMSEAWAARMGLAINDPGKEKSVAEMMDQRIGDYERVPRIPAVWSLRPPSTSSPPSSPSTFADVVVGLPLRPDPRPDVLRARRRRGRYLAKRRRRVLDLPARAAPHGRDRARPGPRRPLGNDVVTVTSAQTPK